MKCCKQCAYAFNTTTRLLGMIKMTIMFKDTNVMMSLYNTLVRPQVAYCISAWNPHYIKDKVLLEKVQRRFTKIINNMKRKTSEERSHCLKLWMLKESRNRLDLIEVYKMCNKVSRLKLNKLLTLDDNIRETREKNILGNLLNCDVHGTIASIFSIAE